jgi:hypothetical protein
MSHLTNARNQILPLLNAVPLAVALPVFVAADSYVQPLDSMAPGVPFGLVLRGTIASERIGRAVYRKRVTTVAIVRCKIRAGEGPIFTTDQFYQYCESLIESVEAASSSLKIMKAEAEVIQDPEEFIRAGVSSSLLRFETWVIE